MAQALYYELSGRNFKRPKNQKGTANRALQKEIISGKRYKSLGLLMRPVTAEAAVTAGLAR